MKKGAIFILSAITGTALGVAATEALTGEKLKKSKEKTEKFRSYYEMLHDWLKLKQEGKSLEQYFLEKEYYHIAIYGMGGMGKRLYEELKESRIQVEYAMDQSSDNVFENGLKVISLEDEMEQVDAVIVTATFNYDEIEAQLQGKTDSPIVSLEDVIYGCC